jgi:hypothetical protein
VLVALCLVAAVSCARGGAAFVFYVVIKPEQTAEFIGAVTAIAKEDGLETAVGQTTSDTGSVLRFAEGRGHGLKLWAQNMMMSGHEDPKLCGVYDEPHPDPRQFLVFTEPRLFETSRRSAEELGKKVFAQLQSMGFEPRQKAAPCGAAQQ